MKTLGELVSELSARLGFGAQGAATGINRTLLTSFLQDAQTQLYHQFDWRNLITYDEKTTGVGQVLYDYAPDCDVDRIQSVAVLVSGMWQPMHEGITWAMRSNTSGSWPVRYERFAQMEIYPPPDGIYTIRRYYVRQLSRFTNDNDETTIDDGLVFLHALSNAKAHYRQPDAQSYATQLDAAMNKIKSGHRGRSVFRRRGDHEPIPKPYVLR